MVDQYIFSGSLPENASTYVTRDADRELYDGLRSQKFCYVLNSRQSGKSSLRVQTMRRLRENGVECAAIDLSAGGIQNVPPEQWYADLIDSLIDIFDLDIDFGDWWEENQLNSLVTRFRKFLEEVLLVEVKEDIVIFIDEIDSVLSLNFPTDDFFAFIRSCYNQRVDNPEYRRLTFCLLGVASPSNLIQEKQRTPFNIGTAISLKGFQLQEIEPLEQGLRGKFSDSQAVIEEILNWTGGQPFLTQKLCQLMVEQSEKENPCTVEEVVKSKIIENWESQDEPEHLRTIRARILRNEERAGYLLELYQQIRCSEEQCEITADNTIEQSELLLSGLVSRREGKLRVYNAIYKEIFNQNWIENELKNLRPYSENFKFWVASGYKDESRLLGGKALKGAEEWARDKNLSYQDKQFLAASREKEIQEKIAVEEREAQLERERKDKEAVEKRNLVLSEANRKAKRRIRNGTVVLSLALLGAVISVLAAWNQVNKANTKHQKIKVEVENVQKLSQLAGDLLNGNLTSESDQALRQAGLSFTIKNHNLKQAILLASMSQAYQKLKKPDKAKKNIEESLEYLNKTNSNLDKIFQIEVFVRKTQGDLFTEQNQKQEEAIEAYGKAFEILKNHPNKINTFKNNQIITAKDIELFHRKFIEIISENAREEELKNQVEESLNQHLYAKFEYHLKGKNWQAADKQTFQLMLNIANRERENFLIGQDFEKISCNDLKKINNAWLQNSNGHFGFSVQKQIWKDAGNRLGITELNDEDRKIYQHLASLVGWYDSKKRMYLPYTQIIEQVDNNFQKVPKGILPIGGRYAYHWLSNGLGLGNFDFWINDRFFSRLANCNL
ncbi:MAG: AAA-like domain-containing protein [Cyanobacteria bacterium P01_D01_bin.50]